MSFKLLPTDYTDATWVGLKRYSEINNEDGTVSFQDVTVYSDKDKSFFGAKDANRMNEALNTLMTAMENGTDLYKVFNDFFSSQKESFKSHGEAQKKEFSNFIDSLKSESNKKYKEVNTNYESNIKQFEEYQRDLFTQWFDYIKSQLTKDQAGNLQNQINDLDAGTSGFKSGSVVFSKDGKTITEIYGDKKTITYFESPTKIKQEWYLKDHLTKTKTVTFNQDKIIEEVI